MSHAVTVRLTLTRFLTRWTSCCIKHIRSSIIVLLLNRQRDDCYALWQTRGPYKTSSWCDGDITYTTVIRQWYEWVSLYFWNGCHLALSGGCVSLWHQSSVTSQAVVNNAADWSKSGLDTFCIYFALIYSRISGYLSIFFIFLYCSSQDLFSWLKSSGNSTSDRLQCKTCTLLSHSHYLPHR